MAAPDPKKLSTADVARIEELANTMGESAAAGTLLINVQTLNRALARRQLRRSTVQCLRSRLREMSEEAPASSGKGTRFGLAEGARRMTSARAWYESTEEVSLYADVVRTQADAAAREERMPLGMTPVYYVDSEELIELYPEKPMAEVMTTVFELYPEKPMPLIIPESVKAEVMRTVYEAWVDAGRPKARKALRLRVEPGGAAARGWLTLLALCGWMRGVVVWDGVGPFSGVGA